MFIHDPNGLYLDNHGVFVSFSMTRIFFSPFLFCSKFVLCLFINMSSILGKIFDCYTKVDCDVRVSVETCIFLMGLFLIWSFRSVGKKREMRDKRKLRTKRKKEKVLSRLSVIIK
jgi:hypothetical protein